MIKKVIIVDDDQLLTSVLENSFKENGWEVMVNNGDSDVVEKILAYNPDMILLDVMMPNINGLDVVKELHDKHTAFCARVIMLTSLENDVYLAKAIEHGVTTYVHKTDVKLEEIVATVERKYQYLLTL